MTPITREYLDALARQGIFDPSALLDLIAALRRVLDLADEADENHARYMEGPILDRFIAPSNVHTSKLRAALAGTQTEAVDS